MTTLITTIITPHGTYKRTVTQAQLTEVGLSFDHVLEKMSDLVKMSSRTDVDSFVFSFIYDTLNGGEGTLLLSQAQFNRSDLQLVIV